MEIIPLNINDLRIINEIQPQDWSDITPSIRFYIESEFCLPIKIMKQEKIVGIGSTIFFDKTAWLAHIIVHPSFRKQGVGTRIVEHQLREIKSKGIPTVLLIATKLGEPVYKKAGFKTDTEYIFLTKESESEEFSLSTNIFRYNEKYKNKIFDLDSKIMGEMRYPLLMPHLKNSFIYFSDQKIEGYYIPTLGEGTIISTTEKAGIELLKKKIPTSDKIVIPQENKTAYKFLTENGFIENSRCSRMFYGKNISWHPENYYSRIGGKLG